ncbi:MAG: glycosyltransferase family 4 protein [Candidatus Paceibacterota bacterium]
MKILLVGEFSGVHNNLKKGLTELGHEVKLAADGDGFKKFEYDFPITPYGGLYFGRVLNLIYILLNIRKFIGYDVIQFISPFSIPTYLFKIGLLEFIFRRNKKIIYYACGTDPNYERVSKSLDYHPNNGRKYYTPRRLKYHNWFINRVDTIVPATYTYYLGYKGKNSLAKSIMLPGSGIYINEVKKPRKKIKILFGITRRDFKGAVYIEEALGMIKQKYESRVDIKIVERMPFEDYIKLLDETDILIDQCKSYFYGMNAIFAMERGVIVLSGAEETAVKYYGIENIPIINIKPNSEQIFIELKRLIEMSDNKIYKLKIESLSYVRNFHGIKKINIEFEKIYKTLVTRSI